MIRLTHPGLITFVECDGGPDKVLPIDQVPASIAFVRDRGVEAPVVKVVAAVRGDIRELKCYGTDGRLLLTTFQRRTDN